jgi:hypothetical protein
MEAIPSAAGSKVKYAAPICDALDAAHKKKHHPSRPGFRKRQDGPAVKADEATMTVALTGKCEILGTLLYMSPEQLQRQASTMMPPPEKAFHLPRVVNVWTVYVYVLLGKFLSTVSCSVAPSTSVGNGPSFLNGLGGSVSTIR